MLPLGKHPLRHIKRRRRILRSFWKNDINRVIVADSTRVIIIIITCTCTCTSIHSHSTENIIYIYIISPLPESSKRIIGHDWFHRQLNGLCYISENYYLELFDSVFHTRGFYHILYTSSIYLYRS